MTAKTVNVGARVYHLRNVMHDWPDRQCQLILEHVIAAMEKDYSKLLIHELVLPNVGANVIGTQVDLTVSFAGLIFQAFP